MSTRLTNPVDTAESWAAAQNILCIRLDSLGDVLMTTPALRAFHQALPGRRITLLTSPAGAKAAPFIPEVDGLMIYEAPWMKATPPRQDSRLDVQMVEQMKRSHFDAAVIFTVFSQNPLPAAMLAFLAEIPLRLAYCRENPYQLLTDWAPEIDLAPDNRLRHEVRRHLDLAALVGCSTPDERLSFHLPSPARKKMAARLAKLGLTPGGSWLVIHPGASAPSRRYPPEHFSAAADRLSIIHGYTILFTGSQSETSLVESIRAGMRAPSISLAGCLGLDELAALLVFAPILISNNSGPVHLAAAVGTPVVDIYALTNPQHTPWGVPHRVLNFDVPCRNCFKSVCPLGHHDCLRRLEPETVVQAVMNLLAELSQPRRAREFTL